EIKMITFLKSLLSKAKREIFWHINYFRLRQPKLKNAIHEPGVKDAILKELKESRIKVIDFYIEKEEFQKYLKEAEYEKYKTYTQSCMVTDFLEKSLEHFLAAKFLELSKDDVYIDIASANSPAPEIYNKLYGCKVYRQDMDYPKGLHDHIIGGDASDMPLEDNFASKLGLHCSFEHFEQDSDINFIIEAGRILKKGGKLCIIPFYLFYRYAILTDPSVLPLKKFNFEDDAVLYCLKGWGNRHGRFYDAAHLISRVVANLGSLKLTIYNVVNTSEITENYQIQYVALFEKT
ncbi:MAG: hypothetical protein JW867_08340, partial [Candidatus Omnitrophica bacterium]|nr:hypothetical protein [Candidatus Omnitrophota bacterium]